MKRRRLPRLRLPLSDVARRAVEETIADGYHEIRAAQTLSQRFARIVTTSTALLRLSLNAFNVFDEGHPMISLGQDLRFAVRRLIAAPMFALFSILTLGVGIGSTTAIYSLIHAIRTPLAGVTDVGSLVNITHYPKGSIPIMGLSYGDFQDLRAQQTVFQGVAGWSIDRSSYVANGVAESSACEIVSGDFFDVLGVVAEKGRVLQANDDVAGAPPVAVISHGVWQRVFGGAPDVIGRPLKINGTTHEVVGVSPPSFRGVFNNGVTSTALWIPMAASARRNWNDDREARWILVKARLKPGVDFDRARAEVTGIANQLDKTNPIGVNEDPRFRAPYVISRHWVVRRTADVTVNESASDQFGPVAAAVMIAVGLVLLVACTNLANLATARGSVRRGEMAVRLALGASRWRLVRELTAEYLVLAAGGGLVGVAFACSLFVLVADEIPTGRGPTLHLDLRLDAAVLAISAGATLLALIVAGLIPALQSTRGDLRASLATGAQQSMPRWRGRRFLIAGQVMVSVLFVLLAGLCAAQVRAQSRINVGIDLEHLALAQVDFGAQRYESARVKQIVTAALTQLTNRSGVVAAAASNGLPIGTFDTSYASFGVGPRLDKGGTLMISTPGIFNTLGLAIVSGRAFDERDRHDGEQVAVISEATAKMLFGRVDVLGESLAMKRQPVSGEPEPERKTLRIVGIATDTMTAADGTRGGAVVYAPLEQHDEARLTLLVRAAGDPTPLVSAMRQTLTSIDRELAVTQAGTGLALAGPVSVALLIVGSVTGLLGSFALFLALVGLCGVLSHVIARRTKEIGVRMALGADRHAILRMILRDGLRPVAFGLVSGLVVGAIVRTAARPLFILPFPAFDALVVVAVPVSMLFAALVAIYLPARRAAGVDPSTALRDV